jgi:hypothetical protein
MTHRLIRNSAPALWFAAAALAQHSPEGVSHFQQPGWVATPGTAVTVHVNRPDGQVGPVVGQPFSAKEARRTIQTLGDGTHVDRTTTTQFYRDAEGRMRIESPSRILIYDPVAGFTSVLDPVALTYRKDVSHSPAASIAVQENSTWVEHSEHPGQVTRTVTPSSAGLPMHTEVAVATTETLPTQFINGISARGSRTTMTIPAGSFGNDHALQVINERWYSDVLGVLLKSENNDPRFGVTTYELTDIVQGSPSPLLFQIPSNYTAQK